LRVHQFFDLCCGVIEAVGELGDFVFAAYFHARGEFALAEGVYLLLHEWCEHPAGTDGVDRDPRGGHLQRGGFREPDDAVLGGDVRRLLR